ncbi:MAG: peptidoglycan-associated lipoprotein Pal [Burkholderiaceae bacterium]
MKRFLLALAYCAVLAGCGSAVKLDDVAVEDKAGTPVAGQGPAGGSGAGTAAGNSGAVTNTAIAPVDLTKSGSNAAAPSGQQNIIYFDYDSFVIKPEFQAVIEAQARFMKANPSRKVSIEGHTDSRGGREYNLALGQKRSEAVLRALVLLGVPESQLEAVSFGKEKLAVPGNDEAAWAKDRRAEIRYR